MKANITHQITRLRGLSKPALVDIWRKLYGTAAPDRIRRELMIPFLAYRIQENAYGGLKPSTRSELRRIGRSLEKSRGLTGLRTRLRIRAGTRLFRQWHGVTHEVVVSDSGYEHLGARYSSLSEIARKITGTQWSGPAFFKLNRGKAISGDTHE